VSSGFIERYIIAREHNVVRVNFQREPDPPAPKFPGAGAMRKELTQSGGNVTPTRPNRQEVA
jgi:hypothetical protein